MKKYKITYICNDAVVDISKKSSDDNIDEYVSGSIAPRYTELFAYSADHAEYNFYKSFSGTPNNLIKILDVREMPVDVNDINTYRVRIDYAFDNFEKSGHGDMLISAVSPQQAELFAFRALCNTDKCGVDAYTVDKIQTRFY